MSRRRRIGEVIVESSNALSGEALAERLAEQPSLRSIEWTHAWNPGMADLEAAFRALATHPSLESLSLELHVLAEEDAARVAALPHLRELRVLVAEELTFAGLSAFADVPLRSLGLCGPPEPALAGQLVALELDDCAEVDDDVAQMLRSFCRLERLTVRGASMSASASAMLTEAIRQRSGEALVELRQAPVH